MSKYLPIYRKRELILRNEQQERLYTFDVMALQGKTSTVGYAIINIDSGKQFISGNFRDKEETEEVGTICCEQAIGIEKSFFENDSHFEVL